MPLISVYYINKILKKTISFKLNFIHFLSPLDIKRRSLHATIAPVPMARNNNLGAKPRRRPCCDALTSLPATRAPESDSEHKAESYDVRTKNLLLLETSTKSSGAYAGDQFTMRKRLPATRAPNSDSEDNASLIIPRASDGQLVAAARKVLADAVEERSQLKKKKYARITAQASISKTNRSSML
jgi:hypothetical protein